MSLFYNLKNIVFKSDLKLSMMLFKECLNVRIKHETFGERDPLKRIVHF